MKHYGYLYGMGLDENDRPVERNKIDYPYSYDGFVVYRFGENSEATGTIYSDRLFQWDPEKYDILCEKHFGNSGQMWGHRDPDKIRDFLSEYTGDVELQIVFIMEYCNQANGYPYWRFEIKSGNNEAGTI
jgi:hypothetical protein